MMASNYGIINAISISNAVNTGIIKHSSSNDLKNGTDRQR